MAAPPPAVPIPPPQEVAALIEAPRGNTALLPPPRGVGLRDAKQRAFAGGCLMVVVGLAFSGIALLGDGRSRSQRLPSGATVAAVQALVAEYVRQHSFPGNVSRSACRRVLSEGMVVGRYACPLRMGNMMHELINAFAIAVVTNRTLLWGYSLASGYARDEASDQCSGVVNRQAWIPSLAQFLPCAALGSGTSPLPPPRASCAAESLLLRPKGPGQWAWLSACSQAPLLAKPLLSLEGMASWGRGSAGLAAPRAGGGFAGARARVLFGGGTDLAFGTLLHHAMSFEPALANQVEDVLARSGVWDPARRTRVPPQAVWLGLHLRHPKSNVHALRSENVESATKHDARRVRGAIAAAFHRLDGASSGGSPGREGPATRVLIIASDRPVDTEAFEREMRQFAVVVVTAGVAGIPAGRMGLRPEHGLRAGTEAIVDLHLLARCDALVGTVGSTFTDLAGEILAYRARTRLSYAAAPFVLRLPREGRLPPEEMRMLPLLRDGVDVDPVDLRLNNLATCDGGAPSAGIAPPSTKQCVEGANFKRCAMHGLQAGELEAARAQCGP